MKKILVANRGEIASRVIRTCKRLGIEVVAVYSEADQNMPFVKEADQAFLIGPPPVAKSYLQAERIIEIASREGVEGIHPGYGFLSEQADFARKVEQSGIKFIGPAADTIAKMGNKIEARKTMQAAGVPVIPGTDEGIESLEKAVALAKEIGYPVMLKASAGGGGIGMVRCEDEQALIQQFDNVKKRAEMYFGNDVVFIEKFILKARHIEVQIFGDCQGNIVHLFERNCSVQRRNQKVIEESPSPGITDETRNLLCQTAVNAARAVQYENAGTVEFIVDEEGKIYFLEMNTRLQVEHPITEELTGIDLVEWQIELASGNELPIKNQRDIISQGHALEFRVYAENPLTFIPAPGYIKKIHFTEMEGIRIDRGYGDNCQVTPHYDPLLLKVIVKGQTRTEAIQKSQSFLRQMEVEGLQTNLLLLSKVLAAPTFQLGTYTTSIIENMRRKSKGEMK